MANFNPDEHNVDEVLDHLKSADERERERVLAAERSGKARKGILEEGASSSESEGEVRYDAHGRELYPWELSPEERETPEPASGPAEEERQQQERTRQMTGTASTQEGGSPAGTGTAPAGGGAAAAGGTTAGGPTGAR